MRLIQLFCWTLSFAALVDTDLQADDFFRKDYSDNWLVYDDSRKEYVPAIGDLRDVERIHFYFNLLANQGRTLELCSGGNTAIFINGSIVEQIDVVCINFDIDSLHHQWDQDSVLFTFYKIGHNETVSSYILYPALGFVPPESPIKMRVKESKTDFVLIATIVLLIAVIAVRERNARFFEEFSDLGKTFALRIRESQLYSLKPYSRELFSVVVLQCLAISLFILTLGQYIPGVEGLITFEFTGFWSKILQWVSISAAFIITFYAYYLLLFVINIFFNNYKLLHIQFCDNLRINQFFFTLLFLLIVGSFLLSESLMHRLVTGSWVLIVLLLVLKGFFIYFKILRQSQHRKIHIFSYFCATEILPIALVVKVVFI